MVQLNKLQAMKTFAKQFYISIVALFFKFTQVTSNDTKTIKQLEFVLKCSASFEACSPVIVNLHILKQVTAIQIKALKFKFLLFIDFT